jgi:hypothetical protein
MCQCSGFYQRTHVGTIWSIDRGIHIISCCLNFTLQSFQSFLLTHSLTSIIIYSSFLLLLNFENTRAKKTVPSLLFATSPTWSILLPMSISTPLYRSPSPSWSPEGQAYHCLKTTINQKEFKGINRSKRDIESGMILKYSVLTLSAQIGIHRQSLHSKQSRRNAEFRVFLIHFWISARRGLQVFWWCLNKILCT